MHWQNCIVVQIKKNWSGCSKQENCPSQLIIQADFLFHIRKPNPAWSKTFYSVTLYPTEFCQFFVCNNLFCASEFSLWFQKNVNCWVVYTRLIEEKVNIKPRKLNRLWSGNQDINRRRKIDCDLNLGLTIPTITCQGTLVFTTASPNAIPYLIIFLYLPELIKRGSLKDLRLKKKKKKTSCPIKDRCSK